MATSQRIKPRSSGGRDGAAEAVPFPRTLASHRPYKISEHPVRRRVQARIFFGNG